MNLKEIFRYLAQSDVAPSDDESYKQWAHGSDFLQFIHDSVKFELVPIHFYSEKASMWSLLVPERKFDNFDQLKLNDWSLDLASRSLCFAHWESSNTERVDVVQPYAYEAHFFQGAEPLYFYRQFSRRKNDTYGPYEFSQKLIHASEAYWVPSEDAYCTLDENGDYIQQFFMRRIGDVNILFANKRKLQLYCHFTNQRFVQLFDIRRNTANFNFYYDQRINTTDKIGESLQFKKLLVMDKENKEFSCYFRGSNILKINLTEKQAIDILADRDAKNEKAYCSFIAYDWKNKKIVDVSCAPGATANYFTESDLPFELSPAFFKPEVLLKYKSNPDKYDLQARQIYCIGGWHLNTYDINEAGQVSAYLCYLRHLPYSEQLYWKAFNEPPKAGLSKNAIATDFEGKWPDPDPIDELKNLILRFYKYNLNGQTFQLIKPEIDKFETVVDSLHYVLTEGHEEWKSEVNKLAAICIDALSLREIRRLAKSLECLDDKLSSIKLLAKCLRQIGIDEALIKEIQNPLQELWEVRSKQGVAHLGNRPKDVKLTAHFKKLVHNVSSAFKLLDEILKRNSEVK